MSIFRGKTALITGASAGLGEEFAQQLAALGIAHLILTARREDRLEELRKHLLRAYPELRVDYVPGDLSEPADVTTLLTQLEENKCTPDILINNAGFGDLGTFETSDPARMDRMISLNISALTRLTRWALPFMLKKKEGWICNVGSTAGLLALPTFAVYAATKAYVNSFSEALRVELYGSGVHVMALCPGPVETEFGAVASRANSKRKFAPPRFLCVDKVDVVAQTLSGLASGQGRLIPGMMVRLPMLLTESMPRWFLRFFFNLMSGSYKKEREKAQSGK